MMPGIPQSGQFIAAGNPQVPVQLPSHPVSSIPGSFSGPMVAGNPYMAKMFSSAGPNGPQGVTISNGAGISLGSQGQVQGLSISAGHPITSTPNSKQRYSMLLICWIVSSIVNF